MSLILRILLIIFAVGTFVYVVCKLRKEEMQITDIFIWFTMSVVVAVMSFFPGVIMKVAEWIGVQSPVNFVYLVFIFFLIIICFYLTIRIARLEERAKRIIEEYALRESLEGGHDGKGSKDSKDRSWPEQK